MYKSFFLLEKWLHKHVDDLLFDQTVIEMQKLFFFLFLFFLHVSGFK